MIRETSFSSELPLVEESEEWVSGKTERQTVVKSKYNNISDNMTKTNRRFL